VRRGPAHARRPSVHGGAAYVVALCARRHDVCDGLRGSCRKLKSVWPIEVAADRDEGG